MNRLIIPNGGMPLEGDDFNWMYSGVLEAFKGGALYPFALQSSGNFIIAGCTISLSGGNASVTEGFVMLNYEICYCPAHTVAVTSLAASSLKIDETYDATGSEVFADAITRDTYAIRRAKISDGLNSGVEIVLENPKRYYSKQTISTFINDWEVYDGNTVSLEKIGNVVHIQGVITGGINNQGAFQFQNEFIPAQYKRYLSVGSAANIVIGLESLQAYLSIYKSGLGEVNLADIIPIDFCYRVL